MRTVKTRQSRKAVRVAHYLKDVIGDDVPVLLCQAEGVGIVGDRVTFRREDVTCPECLERLANE